MRQHLDVLADEAMARTPSENAQLMVYLKGGTPLKAAIVPREMYEELKAHTWVMDPASNTFYRVYTNNEGKVCREYLHRRVMGCQFGDGRIVRYKNDDKFNCTKSNLYIDGKVRDVTKWNTTKYFPSNVTNFMKHIKLHYKNKPIVNILSAVSFEVYSKKKIVCMLEEGADKLSPMEVREKIVSFLVTEFGYKGEVSVIRHMKREADDEDETFEAIERNNRIAAGIAKTAADRIAAEKAAMTASSKQVLVPMQQPTLPQSQAQPATGEAMSFLRRLSGVFGVDVTQDTSLDFCNFGIRQKDEILSFSFTRAKIVPGEKDTSR